MIEVRVVKVKVKVKVKKDVEKKCITNVFKKIPQLTKREVVVRN
jgi:hypothetical protein